jgi:hypothetical protein
MFSSLPAIESNQATTKSILFPQSKKRKAPRCGFFAKHRELDLSWKWVRENSSRAERRLLMQFAAWLVKSGTRRPEAILALVKHYAVHRPLTPFAYYTPLGTAREVIVMGVAADSAVQDHERIKREEREWLERLGLPKR